MRKLEMIDEYTKPINKHSALLIIDVQRDFTLDCGGAAIPGTLQAVSYIEPLVEEYRKRGYPIIHAIRLYQADGSNVDLCRKQAIENGRQIVIPRSKGAELMDELTPSSDLKLDPDLLLSGQLQHVGPNEWIMYKPRWGAFYNTSLEKHLHDLGVNTVVVCGCNFANCPRTTIYEASERDFRIVLAKDATSLVYDTALQELKNIGVSIMSADECVTWLGSLEVGPKTPANEIRFLL